MVYVCACTAIQDWYNYSRHFLGQTIFSIKFYILYFSVT